MAHAPLWAHEPFGLSSKPFPDGATHWCSPACCAPAVAQIAREVLRLLDGGDKGDSGGGCGLIRTPRNSVRVARGSKRVSLCVLASCRASVESETRLLRAPPQLLAARTRYALS